MQVFHQSIESLGVHETTYTHTHANTSQEYVRPQSARRIPPDPTGPDVSKSQVYTILVTAFRFSRSNLLS
jgi:hypothetical protein